MSETINHNEIMRAIGKLEGMLVGVAETTSNMNKNLEAQNGRVRKLEEWKNQQIGQQKVTGVIYGSVSALIVSVVTYFIKR